MSNKITILCAVACEFEKGADKFCVTRDKIGCIIEAPEWLKSTLMFKLLAEDQTLKYVTPANKIQLENDPMLGMTAEGKAEAKVEDVPVNVPEPVKDESASADAKKDEGEKQEAAPKARSTRNAKNAESKKDEET